MTTAAGAPSPAELALPVTDAGLAARLRSRMEVVEAELFAHTLSEADYVTEAARGRGVGKALLAFEPGWFVTSYLSRPLERPTPHTVTEPGRLARELSQVRAQGYATTHEEMTLGSCSAAAPVLVGDRPVAAVGIVVSSRRGRELPRLVDPLLAVAARIAGDYRAAVTGDA